MAKTNDPKTQTEVHKEIDAIVEAGPAGQAGLSEEIPFSKPTEPAFTPAKDTIEVTKAELQAMMDRLASVEADNKRLLDAVDRNRLAKADAKAASGVPLIPEMRLSRMKKDGPIIIAWKLTRNDSFMDGNKAVENQRIEIFYEDGTQEEIPFIAFVRGRISDSETGELVSRTKDESTGEESVTLRLSDGRKVTVGIAFVN